MTLIDGKAISEQVKQEIAAEVAEIVARGGKRVLLVRKWLFRLSESYFQSIYW